MNCILWCILYCYYLLKKTALYYITDVSFAIKTTENKTKVPLLRGDNICGLVLLRVSSTIQFLFSKRTLYSPHMNESRLIMFHKFLNNRELRTKQLVEIENKCWLMYEAKSTIQPKHTCFPFCHPSWFAAFFHSYTVTAFCCWLWVLLLSLQERLGHRQRGRHTDRQWVEGETVQQLPTAPAQIYYLWSRSGHFTAVFTLDPAVSIRWQGPALQMWLPIHRSTTFLCADPPPHFLIRPLTLLIKKIPIGVFPETIIHGTIQSQSLI